MPDAQDAKEVKAMPLWTFRDESSRILNVFGIDYCGQEMFTTNTLEAATRRCTELNDMALNKLADVERALEAAEGELFLQCQPDKGDIFSAVDEHLLKALSTLRAILQKETR